jgi:putative MFS transporter
MLQKIERLDGSLTALHLYAVGLCAVGLGLNLSAISLGPALAAVFTAPPYSVGSRQLTWLLSSVYAGAAIGAPLLGWVADRRGLQRVLTLTLVGFGMTSTLAAAATDLDWFAGFRLLSGVVLGAYPPLMIAYLTAIAPPRRRGALVFCVFALAYLAPPASSFLVRWLMPLNPLGIAAWRWPFVIAGIVSVIAAAAFARLPYGLRPAPGPVRQPHLAQTDDAAVETAQFDRSRRRADFKSRFTFVAAIYFLHPWAAVALPILTAPVLQRREFTLDDTLLIVGIATFSPVVGTLLAGLFVDRISRRLALSACCILQLLSVALFFAAGTPMVLMIAAVSFTVGVALYTPIMTLYAAELFPAASRAAATGAAWSLNRIASASVPFALLPILRLSEPAAIAIVICAALLASIGLVVLFGPRGAAGQAVQ